MGLEAATYIGGLIDTNPEGTDHPSSGDDHIRLLKSALKATFPGITSALTATHTELNYVHGVTAAIQTQFDAKLATSTFTATNILTKLLTVDGSDSGLDADLLDGVHATYFLSAAGFTAANILTKLLTVDGSGSLLDADKLDGQHGSYYLPLTTFTASNILTKIETVDGADSGLDADLLDGVHASYFAIQGSVGYSAINWALDTTVFDTSTITSGGVKVVPAGLFDLYNGDLSDLGHARPFILQFYSIGLASWLPTAVDAVSYIPACVLSDGTNVRIYNAHTSSTLLVYRRLA